MKSLLFCFSLLISFHLFGQDNPSEIVYSKWDADSNRWFPEVTILYNYDDAGFLKEEMKVACFKIFDYKKDTSIIEYRYDSKGRIMRKLKAELNLNKIYFSEHIYKYNDENLLMEEIHKREKYRDQKWLYEYDKSGRQKIISTFYKNEVWQKGNEKLFEYFEEGNLNCEKIIEKSYYKNGIRENVSIKKFDEDGIMVECKSGVTCSSRKFDEQGNVVESHSWRELEYEDGVIGINAHFTSVFENEYNGSNKLVKTVEKCLDTERITETNFEYDSFGRMIFKERIASSSTNNLRTEYFYEPRFENDVTAGQVLEIHPNPVSNQLNFIWEENNKENISYSIYSSGGKLIDSGQIESGKKSIEIDFLENGWYTISIFQGENNKAGKFIVKK